MAIATRFRSRWGFVEGQTVAAGLLLALIPGLPGLAFFFLPFFSANFVAMFFIFFYQKFKNQGRHSSSQAYELFRQINYAAGYSQATERDGQDGLASLLGFQGSHKDAQPGNSGG